MPPPTDLYTTSNSFFFFLHPSASWPWPPVQLPRRTLPHAPVGQEGGRITAESNARPDAAVARDAPLPRACPCRSLPAGHATNVERAQKHQSRLIGGGRGVARRGGGRSRRGGFSFSVGGADPRSEYLGRPLKTGKPKRRRLRRPRSLAPSRRAPSLDRSSARRVFVTPDHPHGRARARTYGSCPPCLLPRVVE